MEKQGKQPFTIIHFNDVYDIQPDQKGQGGIVNFYEQVKELRQKHKNSILLFSGDCFSPSSLSNVFKGTQMVKALNFLNIDVACYGNHQFDFGRLICQQLSNSCNFKWLLGNIKDKQLVNNDKDKDGTYQNLGKGLDKYTIQIAGYKLGIFGLAGEGWLHILGDDYEDKLIYEDIVEHSNKMCIQLRKEKCDIIIALTHMNKSQDQRLSRQCKDIDIILGGHDHDIQTNSINNVPILKSGDNFKSIGVVQVYEKCVKSNSNFPGKRFNFNINVQKVLKKHQEDKQLKDYVNKMLGKYTVDDKIIGHTSVKLDMEFKRCKETNYGNFLTDLIRTYYGCDVAVYNSGAVRFQKINQGHISIQQIQMMSDQLKMKIVSGQTILQMLQNSVSKLPTLSGRFLFVSGIKFTYNLSKSRRVQKQNVMVGNQQLNLNKNYKLVTRQYLLAGKDQYTMLQKGEQVKVPILTMMGLLIKFFEGGMKYRNNSLMKMPSLKEKPTQQTNNKLTKKLSVGSNIPDIPYKALSKKQQRLKILATEWRDQDGITYYSINPKIDGRIKEQK